MSKKKRRTSKTSKQPSQAPPHRRIRLVIVGVVCAVILIAIGVVVSLNPTSDLPTYTVRIVKTYPHDPQAFTQGLVFSDGRLFESTGLQGESTLREVELETGRPIRTQRLADRYFGEGLALWEDRLIQLTWRSGTGFVYDRDTFKNQSQFTYPGEGWGLTHDGKRLILSDGTSTLRFLNPETLEILGSVDVNDDTGLIKNLNELEFVKGEVWANIWQTDRIARIDPDSGRVVGWIDLRGLLNRRDPDAARADVLNGIAYDTENERLFVTGKRWPRLFEIEIVPQD